MMNATPDLGDGPTGLPDPSLDALVPSPSRTRNAVLLVLAVVTVALLWWSPHILRPSLTGGEGATGSWSAVPGHDQVLVVVRVVADGWTGVDVRRVQPVPGASVDGAWVLAEGELDFGVPGQAISYPSGLAFAAARHPSIGAGTALPQPIPDGSTAALAILWNIDDCGLLPGPDVIDGVDVEVRTAIGTTAITTIDSIASPGEFYDTLAELGVCPAR